MVVIGARWPDRTRGEMTGEVRYHLLVIVTGAVRRAAGLDFQDRRRQCVDR